MKRAKSQEVVKVRCDACHENVPSFDITNLGSIDTGYRRLCSRCSNVEMAEWSGLPGFEHLDLKPVALIDRSGKEHEFHFRVRLFGTGVALDAFELQGGLPAGYQFQIIGKPEEDQLALLGRLIDKIRRGLSRGYLKQERHELHIADDVVCGAIEWDDAEDGRVPLLNIDGREVTWQQFGRMLMSFEGWQFKLEIRDKSGEF
jgi:hypothetical protein